MSSARFWEDTPLEKLDRAQWEALCDGCGKCCLHKLEDEDTGELFPTNVACKLLDRHAGRCADYRHRHAFVPECIRLTPETCAYVRRAAGKPLPDWHYLNTGDRESIHEAGMSVRGWTVSEIDAGDLEQHVIDDDSPYAHKIL